MSQVVPMQDAPQPKSVVRSMADRYGMEPSAFEATLRATVVPEKSTKEQFAAFLLVAKEYRLNPLTKEIYAFPTRAGGIQPIVSIDGWMNLVNSHPQSDGMVFEDVFDDKGKLKAITCKMYRKDRSHPTVVTEYMSECVRNTDTWRQWPARMLRHKAAIQCARYAFGFSGIMDEDEYDRLHSAKDITPPPAPKLEAGPPTAPKPEAQRATGSLRDGVKRSKAELARDAVAPRDPALRAGFEAQAPADEPHEADTGEISEDDGFANYDGWVSDMEARLNAANDEEQGEIWDTEIAPRIEDGKVFPPDVDRLRKIVRQAA